ncbi:MAG: 3,4-dihydroxy-2-butanone-4-phosphate synthase [Peptostreptococcaceae bacterium]|jgi:3,4-dihydroxy 2-butanone 4-phosphate synthase/GTP cyclohydrolase II|nr:3,4-dihydroxy-2-butanone-4-phosphate synthase [Peptostreptococcaceae bacterium]
MFCKIEDAIKDLKEGKIIIITDDDDRENEGDFVIPSEICDYKHVDFMISKGKGLLCVSVDEDLAKKLDLNYMNDNNTDPNKTAFTISIDHKDSGTGISAISRALTINEMVKENSKPNDFTRPGHVFPLIAKKYGVLKRNGHTEASLDIAKLAGFKPSAVICEILSDSGYSATREEIFDIAKEYELKIISIKDLIEYKKLNYEYLDYTNIIDFKTKYGDFKAFSVKDEISKDEHFVIFKNEFDNDISKNENLEFDLRIHSECLTGDVFFSKRCDCKSQLEKSLIHISKQKNGALIYLRQEGRGIGLFNKIKAYDLQEKGFDTVQANIELGFKEEQREFFVAANILKKLNINKVNLLTNNPLKINELKKWNVDVIKRIPILGEINDINKFYIDTKVKKMKHCIEI